MAFWRSYWLAWKRISKDARARAFVFPITFFGLYLLAYLAWILNAARHTRDYGWMIAFYAFIFGTGVMALGLLRRVYRRQDELLNASITGRERGFVEQDRAAALAVRRYLEERLHFSASGTYGMRLSPRRDDLPVRQIEVGAS